MIGTTDTKGCMSPVVEYFHALVKSGIVLVMSCTW